MATIRNRERETIREEKKKMRNNNEILNQKINGAINHLREEKKK